MYLMINAGSILPSERIVNKDIERSNSLYIPLRPGGRPFSLLSKKINRTLWSLKRNHP